MTTSKHDELSKSRAELKKGALCLYLAVEERTADSMAALVNDYIEKSVAMIMEMQTTITEQAEKFAAIRVACGTHDLDSVPLVEEIHRILGPESLV